MFQYLEAIKAASESKESLNESKYQDRADTSVRYQGTSYLLKSGYNIDFNQSNKDFIDLNAVDTRYFQFTANIGYFPVIVLLSRQKPTHSLLCIQNKQMHSNSNESKTNDSNNNNNTDNSVNKNERLVDSVVNYGKLVLKNDNTYTT